MLSVSVGGLAWMWTNSKTFNRLISQKKQNNTENSQVLGYWSQSNRYIYISDTKGGMSGGIIALASTDEPNIQISGWNVSGTADVELYRGSIDTVLQYLTHNSEYVQTQKINTDGLPSLLQTKYSIVGNNGEPQLLTLPLEKDGVYIVKLKLNGIEETGLIVRSSIGSILKNAESDMLVWTRSFETKRSVTDGQVRIYNLENNPKELAVSPIGGDGIAHSPLLSEADIAIIESGEYRALLPINLKHLNDGSAKYKQYAVEKQKARYFTFTDRPIYQPGDTVSYKSIIRNDNDTIYSLPSGKAQVVITQGYGDSEQKLCQASLTISDQGSIDGECVLPKTISPGYYDIDVAYDDRDQNYPSSGHTSFQVENYRKPEYSIEVKSEKSTYISGDQMKFTVKGSYFYGQPLANVSINYVVLSSSYWSYDYYSEFEKISGDESSFSWYESYGDELTKGQVTLDKNGQATVSIPATTKGGKNQVISFEATAVDETQNPAFSRRNVLVYAGEYGIFKKDYQSSFKVGESANIPFIIQSWQGKTVAGQSITAQLTRTWYTKNQSPDSKYPTYTEQKETLPEITMTSDKNGQINLNFTPNTGGSYNIALSAKDARQNTIQTEFYIYVYQPDANINTSQSNADYQLSLNQTKYVPNDVAKLSIVSEVTDQDVLLTLQRNYVHRYQTIHLTGKETVVDIQLEANDTPDIFASISGFNQKAFQSNDINISIPPLHKQLAISIKPDRQTYGPGDTASVTVKTTSLNGKPQAAEVALWAMDKSLFELAASNTGDILDTFWGKRYNYTNTSHSLEGVTAEMAEAGGGCFTGETPILLADGTTRPIKDVRVGDRIQTRTSETDSALVNTQVLGTHKVKVPGVMTINGTLSITPEHKVFLNNRWQPIGNAQVGDVLVDARNNVVTVTSIEWQLQSVDVYNLETAKYHTFFAGNIWVHNQKGDVRTILKDTAYWNPNIRTNDQGEATVQMKLPDNLTTWSLAAIGATTDTMVGQSTSEILVSKSVVARPVLPNIVRLGDEIQLSGYVHNYSDAKHAFSVSMQVDDAVVEPATQIVSINSQENVLVTWKVKPTKANETAKVTLKAEAKDIPSLNDAIAVPLPILPYGFYTDRAENIFGSGEKEIKFANDIDIANTTTSITLAPSLMANVLTALESLVSYPYGCSEQTTTKLMTAILAREVGVLEKALKNDDFDMNDIVEKAYTRLAELQLYDGAWGWWRNSNPQLYVTAYIAEALGRSQQAHLEVNAALRVTLRSYYLGQTPKDHQELILKTYALTFLDPDKKGERLVDQSSDSDDVLALAAIANIKNGYGTELVDKLVDRARKQGDGVFWTTGPSEYFGSEVASTGLALQALSLAGPSYKQTADGAAWYLLRNRKQSYWSSTFASVQAIKGLLAYAKSNQELAPNFSYSVSLDGNTLKEGKITSSNQLIRKIIIDPTKIKKDGSKINIQLNGSGQLYSTVSMHELHNQPRSVAENNGFTLTRRYVNQKGQINQFAVGDLVTVELSVAGFSGPLNYLAIEDQLPAGMIPVNTNLKNEQENRQNTDKVYTEQDATPQGMILAAPYTDKPTTFTYKARVVTQGVFNTPPAIAHLMYAQENYARTEGLTVTINKDSSKIMGSNGLYLSTPPTINYNLIMYIACPLIFISGGIVFFFLRRRKIKQLNQIIHEQNNQPPIM